VVNINVAKRDAPAADIIGPIQRSKVGFQYILVIQDLFTKWIECKALRSATGIKIREALEDLVISRWGTPQFILTDGTDFVNRTIKSFADEHKITHTTVPPYHPQANPVERVNRILKTMIIALIEKDHREWDRHISEFRFTYNTAFHSSLGTSPAFLNLGWELKPVQLLGEKQEATEIEVGDTWDGRSEWKDYNSCANGLPKIWIRHTKDNPLVIIYEGEIEPSG